MSARTNALTECFGGASIAQPFKANCEPVHNFAGPALGGLDLRVRRLTFSS
jgi:hypothetical protein